MQHNAYKSLNGLWTHFLGVGLNNKKVNRRLSVAKMLVKML